MVFRNNGETAYATTLLNHAIQLYSFANNFRGRYSDSFPEVRDFYKLEPEFQFEFYSTCTNAFSTVPGVDMEMNYFIQLLGCTELQETYSTAQIIIISGRNSE